VGDGGGGVYCFEGGTLTRCTIGENGANDGGGMYFDGGYGSASNCTIIGNTVGGMGGGVCCQGGGTAGAQLYDCTIESNTAWEGGGVCAVNAGAEFYHCTIQGNWADNEGGGVLLASTETTSGGVLWYCVITDNESPRGGGVLLGAGGDGYGGDAVSCIIAGNDAADGGGVYAATVGGGNPGSVAWCTIVDNIATNAGGGIYWNNAGSALSCIIYDNSGGNWYQSGSGMSYTYCCTTPLTGLPNPSSCIDADPRFVNAPIGDYHLRYGSPCIDAGGSVVGTVTNDLDGDPRPLEGDYSNPTYTDIGADEYNPVTADSDGDTMRDDWEHRYDLNPTNAADAAGHADADGINNRDEHTADTCPTNGASYFHLTDIDKTNSFAVEFVCTNSRAYSLQFATNMVDGQWSMVNGATNVAGSASGTMSLTDTVDSVQRSYRVGVGIP
ncbi:MAG: choice-of-anchor Q domain-containing protein, partial [Planctomycetota bacterium]